jgi:hypothetical protein
VTSLVDPSKVWSIKVGAKADVVDIKLEGGIRDPLTVQGLDLGFAVNSADVAVLAAVAGQQIPLPLPLSLAGRLNDTGAKKFRIDGLNAVCGPNDAAGVIDLDLSGKKLKIKAELSSKTIDASSSPTGAHPPGQPASQAPAKTAGRIFPNDKLDMTGFHQVDADLRISAGRLVLPKMAVNDLKAQIRIDNGQLTVTDLSAGIWEGTLKGNATVNAIANPEAKAALAIEGLNLARMLKDLQMKEAAEGRVDADLNVAGRGQTIAAIMAGLNGHSIVKMRNGRFHSGYLDLLNGDIASGLLKLLDPVSGDKNATTVNCLVSRLDIADGLADTTVLVVDTNLMSIVGDGRIDLGQETLDIAFQPHAKKGVGGMSLNLGELSKPFRLTGTLANPRLAVDKGQAATAIGRAVGGLALLGPAGLASLLVGQSGDQDPCPAALEAARTGVKPAKAASAQTTENQAAPSTGQPVQEKLQQLGDKLKGLWGK